MTERRASDRLQRNGTVAGFAILAFAISMKWIHQDMGDALLLALVAAGSALLHPAWLIDQFRKERDKTEV